METIGFSDAFKYPFKNPRRLLYILIWLLPVVGWFVLFGYMVRIVNEFIEGKYEGLPPLYFMEDLKLGFIMFLKSLPFILLYSIIVVGIIFVDEIIGNALNMLLAIFVIPILTINFLRKQTVGAYFEFGMLKYVMDNFGDYVIIFIKQYALILVFAILSIVLIGIPALYFTSYIFIANFYGRFAEKQTD